jgi:predicted metal-dependent phosphoesterase TrpH
MHSVYSDGAWTPAELVRDAKEKQLSVIALTDHDTIAGLVEARKQAELVGIQFVDGVEINSCYELSHRRGTIHVLGYLFDPELLEPYMMRLKEVRDEHNEAIRNALCSKGIEICYEDMNLPSEYSMVNRLYFAEALVRKGYAENVKEALAKYLRKGGIAYVEGNYPPFREVAQKLKEAGGIVVLAHPGECSLTSRSQSSIIVR